MTTTLIVLAHPERRSFNGTWAKATARACEALGHTVLWSDLAEMRFDPVESARHYPERSIGRVFDALHVQEEAAKAGDIPEDVSLEIDKLRRADRVVFHFPLWWFAPPAVLKGWFDRVLMHGAVHTVDQRFDRGSCVGKKALFCVTTGSSEAESAHNGKEGDVRMLIWPTAYTLRYLGFTVLVPEIAHGVHGYHQNRKREALQQRLQTVLSGQAERMELFDQRSVLTFNSDADFDRDGRLKPSSLSHSCFIRHSP